MKQNAFILLSISQAVRNEIRSENNKYSKTHEENIF